MRINTSLSSNFFNVTLHSPSENDFKKEIHSFVFLDTFDALKENAKRMKL